MRFLQILSSSVRAGLAGKDLRNLLIGGSLLGVFIGLGGGAKAHADTVISDATVNLQFDEQGDLYFSTSYLSTTTSAAGKITTATFTNVGADTYSSRAYDGLGATLSYDLISVKQGGAGDNWRTDGDTTNAWIVTEANSPSTVADLIIFNNGLIDIYHNGPTASLATQLVSSVKESGTTYAGLTTVSGLENYLTNARAIAYSVYGQTYVSGDTVPGLTGTPLTGYGYRTAPPLTSGAGAMQYDGTGPGATTDITFVSAAPLPRTAWAGIILMGGVALYSLLRRRSTAIVA